MNYTMKEKEAFEVVGKPLHVSVVNSVNKRRIPEFWEELNTNGFTDRLAAAADSSSLLGICTDYDGDLQEFTYLIAAEKHGGPIPEGCCVKTIRRATWAVFEAIGPVPGAVQNTWERIFSEWFPSTGYEHAGGPEIEVYDAAADITDEKHRTEIWIPVKKK
ncbi:hypothetical protein AXI59_04630 [Bacillus nakamurai]|uniref:GyrI-like domain-containing protein n=1 Tax=Bacillus nakamurai TaxID=1793963 RepID=UPI00077865B9|nr:GyrI-like domain-containing protein [Bacillus nakamurai]KXZ15143.1 hypothetical protein AXI59_04630 [Bacillus nakamurai]